MKRYLTSVRCIRCGSLLWYYPEIDQYYCSKCKRFEGKDDETVKEFWGV